jgi:molybdate transport system substrate-binding protein
MELGMRQAVTPGLVVPWLLVIALVLPVWGLNASASGLREGAARRPSLTAWAGGQLKAPLQRLAGRYEKKTGVKVQWVFNNCGFLLGQLQIGRKGDIFIAGSMDFVQKAKKEGIAAEVTGPLAYHVPVIVTPLDNPASIRDVRDLAGPGVQLLLPDTRATAIGMDVAKTFDKLGITAQVERNTIASLATPAQALAAMLMGRGDAAVVSGNELLKAGGRVHVVPIDPKVNVVGTVHCVVLSFSSHPREAKDFAAFLAASGPKVFAAYGFQTVP